MKKLIKLGLIILGLVLAGNVFAISQVSPGDVNGQIPTSANTSAPFSDQLAVVLNVLLALASTVAVLFVIFGGYTYITAAGNEDEMKSAKKMIVGAIIGLVVIILSFAAVNFINQMIG